MFWLSLVTFALALYGVIVTALWWLQKQKVKANEDAEQTPHLRSINEVQNPLSDPILQKADEAQSMIQTFQKFVPRQFVDHFAMGGAASLKLGYAHEDSVALMFCDIRGFTGLSEKMSPQQLMNFLNSYFLRMNAPIHDNFGFIDKFIGDAIMALFDHPNGSAADKAADAVQAALDLQKALRLYNHHRANSGYSAIRNGVGLHYGPVVLGTVGSDDRMDTTVIGDAVNIAQRIETLTDYFGIDILASKELAESASKHIEFAYRSVDSVVLKGKSTSIELVEIYQHLNTEEIALRNATVSIIQQGIELRASKHFKQACDLFSQALQANPNDQVLKHHYDTCKTLQYQANWDGKIYL